jgi:transposase
VDRAKGGTLDGQAPRPFARRDPAEARLGLLAAARLYAARAPPAARESGRSSGASRVSKTLHETVEEERAKAPDRVVELWAEDEHRAGLKPILRRVWAKKGQRPIAVSHPRDEWLYLYGFVHPASGAVQWFSGSTVDTDLFAQILASFARAVGAGPKKLILLVLDGAGWHVSPDLAVPEGIRLVFLPSYSPELQPAEHLWPLTNEAIANKHFDTLDEPLATRCCVLTAQPDTLKAHTLFQWWPKAA